MNEVYRGVIEVRIMLEDQYGNKHPGRKRLFTKPYKAPGTAGGQATIIAKRTKNVIDKYVEHAVVWERL